VKQTAENATAGPRIVAWQRRLPWLIAGACFTLLYYRLSAAAARAGSPLPDYFADVFRRVSWSTWLAFMLPYSVFYFAVDSLVVWRVVNWFNARVPYRNVLPVRASTYILSLLNEQVGKGAMAFYLNRREGVPGWQVASSMLFLMFCEFYYLLGWATLGTVLRGHELPPVFSVMPVLASSAGIGFLLFYAYARGFLWKRHSLRERALFHTFRRARLRHYAGILLLRSPAMLAAAFVYTSALELFGVTLSYAKMLAYLPIVFFGAAVPGPLRTVAITLWVELFPEHAGELAAFGFVQHNFFIFFNAAIGLLFLRRAQREIFSSATHTTASECETPPKASL